MRSPFPRPHCTRLSTSSHPYSVHLSNARVNQYLQSVIPYTGQLWNSLPMSVFPPANDLIFFFQKRSVKTPLMLTGPSPPAFISPTILFTGSGDKPDTTEIMITSQHI